MLNVLIPLAGPTPYFNITDFPFPKPLIEIRGKLMVEHVITNLNTINIEKRYIFLLRDEDCVRFHLDETIRLLAGPHAVLIRIAGQTRGAVCSSLLAIEHIDNDESLVISNGDQLFQNGLSKHVPKLLADAHDGGCIVFDSVHPRWSYVRLDHQSRIIEAAEKRPISKQAIAGIYAFSRGKDFVTGAKESIRKGASHEGQFYISSVLNELILMNRTLIAYSVPKTEYVTFYSPQKIAEYESGSH